MSISKLFSRLRPSFLDRKKDYVTEPKTDYSTHHLLQDELDKLTGHILNYDEEKDKYCNLIPLPTTYSNEVRKFHAECFNRIVNQVDYSTMSYYVVRELLTSGKVMFVVNYDSDCGIYEMFPTENEYCHNAQYDKIIELSYSSTPGETYIDRFYSILKQNDLVESCKILVSHINSPIYKKFIIPVGRLSKEESEQKIYEFVPECKKDLQWDETTGEVNLNGTNNGIPPTDYWIPCTDTTNENLDNTVPYSGNFDKCLEDNIPYSGNFDKCLEDNVPFMNGASNLPHSKDIWFGTPIEGGSPDIETIPYDDDYTKILIEQNSVMYNTEEDYTQRFYLDKFISRLRGEIKRIITVPLYESMVRKFQELAGDTELYRHIDVNFDITEVKYVKRDPLIFKVCPKGTMLKDFFVKLMTDTCETGFRYHTPDKRLFVTINRGDSTALNNVTDEPTASKSNVLEFLGLSRIDYAPIFRAYVNDPCRWFNTFPFDSQSTEKITEYISGGISYNHGGTVVSTGELNNIDIIIVCPIDDCEQIKNNIL